MGLTERLKEIRLQTGLNQKEYAEKIGVNLSNYSSYERGIRRIYPDTLVKIAEFTHVNLHWLITGDGNKILSKQGIMGKIDNLDEEAQFAIGIILSDNIIKSSFYNLFKSQDEKIFEKNLRLFSAIVSEYYKSK